MVAAGADGDGGNGCWQFERFGHAVLDQRHRYGAALHDLGAALGGPTRVERQIGGAGDQDAHHGHHLFPPLFHHHCNQRVGLDTACQQLIGDGSAVGQQLTVGNVLIATSERDTLGCTQRTSDKGRVQAVVRELGIGIVGQLAQGRLRGRQLGHLVLPPQRVVIGERFDQPLVGAEHGFEYVRLEHLFDRVPVEDQATVEFKNLIVQPYLRGLADAPHHGAEALQATAVVAAAAVEHEGAGENHRQNRPALGIAALGHLAQHFDGAHFTVVVVAQELVLQAQGALDKALALAAVNFEHDQVGEVAHQGIDFFVHGLAVEHRQVQAVVRGLAPAVEDFGERGQQNARWRDATLAGSRLERLPLLGRQHKAAALELVALGRVDLGHDGQHRRLWQLVDAVPPVLARAGIGRQRLELFLGQHIVAEGQRQRRRRALFIEVAGVPLLEDQQDAPGVEEDEVPAQEQAGALRVQARSGHLEQRPAVRRNHAF